MIEELKKNIVAEKDMAKQLMEIYDNLDKLDSAESKIQGRVANSLINRIKILNDSMPHILDNISVGKKLESMPNKISEKKPALEKLSIRKEVEVIVSERGKAEFLKELNIDADLLKKLKRKQKESHVVVDQFQTANQYGKLSNKMFFELSQKLINDGYFKSLRLDIRKSNMNVLSTTYLSMMFFTTVLATIVGIFAMVFFLFVDVDFLSITAEFYSGSYVLRLIKLLWMPFVFPLVAFVLFYSYPGAEKRSIADRINQEIPFVVIHMASISGSGIEPIDLFKIIATSKEYEYSGREFRKILNQTNLYGYDLTTALRNISLSTPSQKLSELLNGVGVTINSGGDIRKFFEKRAESLLLEYRLEREKANKSAETFMDLYISIVIATPMIMVMLLVIISISGISTGFNSTQMTTAIIGIVAIINILFMTFLHMKQPTE